MVVGEFERPWRIADICEEASVGVLLACARNGGMNNKKVNDCAGKGKGLCVIIVWGARKLTEGRLGGGEQIRGVVVG